MQKQKQSYHSLLQNDAFLENLYAVLTAWGMHRMGPGGSKLKEFSEFKKNLKNRKLANTLEKLKSYSIENLNDIGLKEVKDLVKRELSGINIMASGSWLVGNSKLFHHLLPTLMPPIDRNHTLKHMGKSSVPKNKERQIELLCEVVEMYLNYYRKYKEIIKKLIPKKRSFDTSIIKIIDNAIVGSKERPKQIRR